MIKIIYTCYGGAHSSPVAAAIHLGWLPEDRVPSAAELLDIPRFDRASKKDHGVPELMGQDSLNNEVYVLGRGAGAKIVEKAFAGGYQVAGGKHGDLLIVCTLTCVNTPMRVGGYLSRSLGWVGPGRPIVCWGTQRAYTQLVSLVKKTKADLQRTREGR